MHCVKLKLVHTAYQQVAAHSYRLKGKNNLHILSLFEQRAGYSNEITDAEPKQTPSALVGRVNKCHLAARQTHISSVCTHST